MSSNAELTSSPTASGGTGSRLARAVGRGALVVFGLALVLSGSARALGQDALKLEQIGGWGGPVTSVHVEGDVAFVGAGQRLVALDVSTKMAPFELSSLNLGTVVRDFIVRDGYAYVVTRSGPHELSVVDVSDPENIDLVWSDPGDVSFKLRGPMAAYGDYLYVFKSSGVPRLYDISDPEQPTFSGEALMGADYDIDIVGDLAFATFEKWLLIYDLSADPTNPEELFVEKVFPDIGVQEARGVEVREGLAYVLVQVGSDFPVNDVVVVLDVSDPSSPTKVGSFTVTDEESGIGMRANDIEIEGDTLFVSDGALDDPSKAFWEAAQGLLVYDLGTDPVSPSQMSSFKTHNSIDGVEVFGNTAYLFDSGLGLVMLDVSDPSTPEQLGWFHSPASPNRIARRDEQLLVCDEWNGFSVLDVSGEGDPHLVGSYQTRPGASGGGNWGIDVHDDIVVISTGEAGLEVVDISVPEVPVLLGYVEDWSPNLEAMDLVIGQDGDYVFVAARGGVYLTSYDISDPANIFEVDSVDIGGAQNFVYDIELDATGDLVHVGNGGGVNIVDVSVPADLKEVSACSVDPDEPTKSRSIVLNGDWRYVGDEYDGLAIQDVSEPSSPICLEPINYDTSALAMGDWLFQARSGNGRLQLWDGEGDDLSLIHESPSDLVWYPADMVADGDTVYVANDNGASPHVFFPRNCGFVIYGATCVADFNGDDELTILDFIAFQNAFTAGDESADVNDDGVLNILDFVGYQNLFTAGCPD